MVEDAEVGSLGSRNCEDEIVEKSPLTTKNLNSAMDYLTAEARLAFTQWRKALTKAPILWHFDPKCHIRLETGVSGYAIARVLSQLTLDNLGQWHLIAFYSQKMIPTKTWYKTHDGELLAIVEAFKTWQHYLKDCKHKFLILTDYNNLCRFINPKSLSSCQVR